MRNILSNTMTLGAVVLTTTALDITDVFAAGDKGHAAHVDEHGHAILEHADGGHHDSHYAEIEGLPQLDFTTYTSQIFWMFVFFIILYVFFAKKTLPEISGAVETRREKIGGDLDSAQDLKEQAETVRGEYEDALQKAREKATETFKKAEDKIKEENNAKLEAFKDRSAKLTADAENKIEKAKDAAMADTQTIAAEIASIAAEKIVGISTDIKQAETLVKNIKKKAA